MLERFVEAQRDTYARALAELSRGRKTSHWMWFVFPQLSGLGTSPTGRHYAIRDLGEAQAYLRHPVLGVRLVEAAQTARAWGARRSLTEIFGAIDALKFVSSMTLFERASHATDRAIFAGALDVLAEGHRDERTLALLAAQATD